MNNRMGPPILPTGAVVLGRSAYFGTVPAAVAGTLSWLAILISVGPVSALEYSFLLLIAAYLGATAFWRKLRLDGSILRMTVIGPWQQAVDLRVLESIRWKHTGAALSRGSMFVRDHRGGKVRIGVGDFNGIEVWGNLLLKSAQESGATVDAASRHFLEGAGAPRARARKYYSWTVNARCRFGLRAEAGGSLVERPLWDCSFSIDAAVCGGSDNACRKVDHRLNPTRKLCALPSLSPRLTCTHVPAMFELVFQT